MERCSAGSTLYLVRLSVSSAGNAVVANSVDGDHDLVRRLFLGLGSARRGAKGICSSFTRARVARDGGRERASSTACSSASGASVGSASAGELVGYETGVDTKSNGVEPPAGESKGDVNSEPGMEYDSSFNSRMRLAFSWFWRKRSASSTSMRCCRRSRCSKSASRSSSSRAVSPTSCDRCSRVASTLASMEKR
ncbi:hypothetical protein C8Q80DRAFT_36178 [Daedaleopsis nitida]|nr:hypothetical protein C8Q80DRAFT_370426 [Daedaleopsis nitida]KAI0756495.1 hypothetical protein C8Q80DRAFT_36178 [Daedaleopsis nitida]